MDRLLAGGETFVPGTFSYLTTLASIGWFLPSSAKAEKLIFGPQDPKF
jgi:hypothetical protein